MEEQLLTIAEAADRSRMSESWWRQRVHRKEVRYVKIGTRVFIPISTIETVQTVIEPRAGSKYC